MPQKKPSIFSKQKIRKWHRKFLLFQIFRYYRHKAYSRSYEKVSDVKNTVFYIPPPERGRKSLKNFFKIAVFFALSSAPAPGGAP